MADRLNVTVADGKYTVIQREDGSTTALRYGEPWPAFSGASPDNLHMALAYEVAALREQNAAAPELLEALKGMIDMYKELVDSGDAGFWDAEQVKEVIAGRAAIAKAEGRA